MNLMRKEDATRRTIEQKHFVEFSLRNISKFAPVVWCIIQICTLGLFAHLHSLAGTDAAAQSIAKKPDIARTPAEYSPLVNGVDHFFAYSTDPLPLYKFFRDTLGLPQVWDYRDFGDFASGGVWMGNVEFEVVTWKPAPGEKPPTEFKGIAFEPVGYTDSLVKELDSRSIKYAKPEPTMMKDKDGRDFVGWINTGIDGPGGIPPSNVSVFVYDSTSKEGEAARNARSTAALEKAHGGPLGIVAVKELVVGVVDLKAANAKWRTLMDRPEDVSGNLYRFRIGPAVRLVKASTDGFKGIVVHVRSLRNAKEFLTRRNMLKKSNGDTVAVDPSAVGGLDITLEQIKTASAVTKD